MIALLVRTLKSRFKLAGRSINYKGIKKILNVVSLIVRPGKSKASVSELKCPKAITKSDNNTTACNVCKVLGIDTVVLSLMVHDGIASASVPENLYVVVITGNRGNNVCLTALTNVVPVQLVERELLKIYLDRHLG